MLVAVFRARADGERTAARLRALGHEALLAPVFDIVPTGEPVPPGPFDGVIVTSAHGVETLPPEAAAFLLSLPCFCVGDRTAAVAEARGFANIRNARADAEQLAMLVCEIIPAPARLLLLAGRDRKPTIEARLGYAGYAVKVAELYEARAVTSWGDEAAAAFRTERVAAALHYSHRSATLALRCAEAGGVSNSFSLVRHLCLSDDAAQPLRETAAPQIAIAAEPNEASLLALLNESL